MKVNREWLLICASHNLLKLFRYGAGMYGKVRSKGATGKQQGHVPDHGQWDFQATIRLCLTAPRKNCCRRVVPADQHRQLVNPQTGC